MSAQPFNARQSTLNGFSGVFYQSDRPTKNTLEKKWIDQTREKVGQAGDLQLLQKTFDRMK
jgi:2-oxoglutarate/2-oxoacid ferredoxin oxidoreductase subunit beta